MYKTTNCRRRNGSANSFKSIVMLLMIFVGFGSYAQYCEVSTTYSGDYLSSVTTSNALQNVSYTASSQPADSYDDKTDQVIMQAQGLSFDISTDYVGGTNGVNVWIDFDGNEEFDDVEKVFSATGATAHSGTITIPSVVAIGEYRMRVRGQWGSSANPPACGNVSYGSTVDFTLSVTEAPDCMPPSGLTATALSLTSMELSWTSDGDSFEVEWGEAGFEQGDGTTEVVTDTSLEVTTVTDTPYDFYVRQNCGDDGYSMWAGPFPFVTGYCNPTYEYGCSGGAKISNFTTSDAILNIANETGSSSCGANGYNDFTSMSASSPAEAVVGITVGVGSYSGGVKVWIDWNNNGVFDDDELMAESASTITSGSSFTGSFTVPAGTSLGDYRIRVRVVEGNTSFDPCSNYNYGETEDYTFTVIEEPDCMPPTGLGIDGATFNSADLSWVSSGDLFDIEWGETGFEQGEGTMVEGVTENPYTLEGLEAETGYEFYVRQDCGDDGVSEWAGPFYFFTGYCSVSTTYTGDYTSAFSTTGAYTNVTYSTSSQPAGSYSNQSAQTISQSAGLSFDFSTTYVGGGNGVNIWVDYNNNFEFEESEKVFSLANSDASKTGTITIPADTPVGEYRMRVRSQYGSTANPPACGNVTYGSTIDFTLNVVEEPDCMPPTGLGIDGATFNSAELAWVSDGDLFDIEWGEAGFEQGEGTIVSGVTNPYTLEGLEAETGYEFYVRQDCGDDGVSLWAGPFYFFTGYCSVSTTYTGDYTSAFSTTGAYTNVTYSTSSQPAGSYSNQSAQTISQSAGLSFDFSTTYVGGGNGVNIWIDYNNNFEFEESEKVFSLANSDATKTGTITIPADTPVGEYRMRVRSQYGSTANPPACGNVTYGSTIDFTLNVVEEPDCMPPTGLGVDGATFDSADLSWVSDGDLFDIEWGETGFEQGEGAIVSGVTNPYTLEGLEAETGYEFYVRQDCGDDGVSLWAGPFYFFTGYCEVSTTYTGDYTSAFSTTNALTNVTYSASSQPTGSYSNQTSQIITQSAGLSFDFSTTYVGGSNGVNIWVDYNNNFEFEESEIVFSLANSNATKTGTITIPADTPVGEYRMRVRSQYGSTANPPACGNVTYGSTIDFTLNVVETPDCLPPTDIEIEVTCDIPPVANVMWNPGGEETSWEYALTESGDAEPTEGTIVDEPFVQIPDLESNQDYMFWIKSKCGDDGDSVWINVPFNSNASPVAQAQPFCAGEEGGILFENVSDEDNAEEYGNLSCLGSTPNPVWYFLQIDQPGNLDFEIIQNTAFDANGNPTGTGLDVDYIAWGPFDSMQDACISIDLDNPTEYEVDCSYSGAPVENFSITNAQEGEIYVLLITNFNGAPGLIKLQQTNYDEGDSGNTDCSFLCEVDLGEDIIACDGTEVILEGEVASTGVGTEITETRWYFGDELIDPDLYSDDGLSITVTQSGTYRLEVEKESCTEDVVFDEIDVIFIPAYGEEIPDTIELCDDLNDGVEVFDLGAYKDELNLGDYDIELYASMDDLNSGTNPLPDLYESGNATIYAKISSTILSSCSSVQEIELILVPLETPVVEFSYDDILCYDNLDFALPYYADGFTFGGTFSSSAGLFIDSETGEVDIESSIPGTYEVLYDYKVAPGNCGEDDSYTTTVTISEAIQFEMISYCNGGKTIIEATNLRLTIPDESYTLTWTGAEKLTDNTAVVNSTGDVILYVEDQNGCSNSFNLSINDISCMITKGISPNGDGLNDRFDLSNYWVMELKIFNRDGVEVYSHGAGYTNQWEGQSNNGNMLPDGTYYYSITTNLEQLTGWIQLARETR